MITIKKYLIPVLKNTLCSPVLLMFAIIAGIAGIVREIRYAVEDGYNGERMTLVWIIPIEILLSIGCFVLAPHMLPDDVGYNIYHLGAFLFWVFYIVVYSLFKAGFDKTEASQNGDTIWEYFGEVVPLFVLSVDIIILLILGMVYG